jgi:microsomal dipeptidase-like Zn-dependent dipeptidase
MRVPRLALPLCLAALLGVAPAGAQVQGYVDLHSHLMAEDSFGGSWFWGDLEGPINPAVVRCDGSFPFKTHASLKYPFLAEVINGPLFGDDGGDTGWHLGKRRGYDERRCRRFLWITIPGTCPQPHFEGWPTWTTIAHQQMWQGWLQQAHQGGLQAMVVSLAESNFLCTNTPPLFRRFDCDEMASVRRQAQFLQGFVSRNSGWVGIARTAAEARALIAQGKLALVMAVETTKLFPTGDYLAQLDDWRNLGIRSVQVVHHADNRFGGAAQIKALKLAATIVEILDGQEVTGINDIVCRDSAGTPGPCDGDQYLNEKGLSQDGQALVLSMMNRGMLLDVSHLSRKSFRDVYNLALPHGYPILYSHVHTWDTISSNEKNEKYLRDDEIHMITDTHGMVGLRTGPEDTVQYSSAVGNICQGSARSFAQSLTYAVDHGLDVGFGADFNGFTRQMKPRDRVNDCPVDSLRIAFNGGPNWFQSKGLGHVGLLPQLMSDLPQISVPQPYIDHLNHSAETFLRLWERSESLAVVPAANLARLAVASASSTYCSGTFPGEHCYSPGRVNDGSPSTALGGFESWANDGNTPLPQWVELTWNAPVTAARVDLYTTNGYPLQAYDVEYWDDATASWVQIATVNNNTATYRQHLATATFTTRRLRILARLGPAVQAGYVRINEIEVY